MEHNLPLIGLVKFKGALDSGNTCSFDNYVALASDGSQRVPRRRANVEADI
jgi:hypothetical protein